MRAERLPDLVNQNQAKRRTTAETIVTATFDISDIDPELLRDEANDPPAQVDGSGDGCADRSCKFGVQNGHSHLNGNRQNGQLSSQNGQNGQSGHLAQDWRVTRRLRVTPQGTYTSNYYINGEPCTLNQLHEQLQRFRIYPEGYNVVLQGDVTSIISMNARERREIIDELAGVAAFDRKIDQARAKLDVVKEREERFQIVERELNDQLERLDQDRKKAEKYQQLKATLQTQMQWEVVLQWRSQQAQAQTLTEQIAQGRQQATALTEQIAAQNEQITATSAALTQLNAQVKALGEDDHLALQAQLATQEAELRQLGRQEQALRASSAEIAQRLQQTQQDIQTQGQTLGQTQQQLQTLTETELTALQAAQVQARQQLQESREATTAIASASETWVQQQTDQRRQIEAQLGQLEPLRAEQVRLQERTAQLQSQIASQRQAVQSLTQELPDSQAASADASPVQPSQIQALAQAVAEAEAELQTQQETQSRLLQEQRQKQRELDKLEAQEQALQETQGTQATELLVRSGLSGICGLVAQLGRVDPKYQTALEIAAGGRLGYLVVEHDGVAAKGIDLLKRQRAGRATFLPLNSIRVPRFKALPAWDRPSGFVDYAVNLIDCDPKYQDVFAFVFGGTAVFETLNAARPHLGDFRMVTLDGEVLEASGAITGGSLKQRGRLHFGTVDPGESAEAQALRRRLQEIEQILRRCEQAIATAAAAVQSQSQALIEARQTYREQELRASQAATQQQQVQQRLTLAQQQLAQSEHEQAIARDRLQALAMTLLLQEAALQQQRQALAELEQSQTHREWQQAQAVVRELEEQLNQRQAALQQAERQQQALVGQQQRLQERIQAAQQLVGQLRQQQQQQLNQQAELSQQQQVLQQTMAQTQAAIAALDQKLAAEKTERDRAEHRLREQRHQHQQLEWQQQKLAETQQARQQQLAELESAIAQTRQTLPQPLPEIPAELSLEELHKSLKSLQRRIEALEPVNMLALEEYNRTQERLVELTDKLTTLEAERTELLLRIENFTTLRRTAFQEAFVAVNENFQSIFAELSDGDGYLQLDDSQDPFNGGLNLVAHPKGKPVRRLASMSGGEKSLTALSFIFALQRYRPSPFYAFDEVDMFLDGANVERLSKMIQQQAQQAQFIVVSLRRPMIESAERTIGVTQARGAYTQVLGINLAKSASS